MMREQHLQFKVIGSSSSGNCILVDDGRTTIALDAGIPYGEVRKSAPEQIQQLEAVLVTHEHKDHSIAGEDFAKRAIPVYASAGTISAMKWRGYNFHAVGMESIDVGQDWLFRPFRAMHDAVEPMSFFVGNKHLGETLAYITDTRYPTIKVNKVDHLLIEANYRFAELSQGMAEGKIPALVTERVVRNHMSIESALQYIASIDTSRLKGVYLLHLSDANSDARAFKIAVQEATGVPVYIC